MIPPAQEVGDKYASQISQAFMDWRDAYEAGTPTPGPIRIEPFNPTELIKACYAEAGMAGAEAITDLVKGPSTGFSFNLRSPQAEAWIKDYAAKEIKYIDAQTRKTIQQITLRAFEEGLTPQQQSKLIRQYIGLLPQHATAVENFRKALGDIDSSLADKMEERYRKKLLKWRADTIALSESHTASNEGNRESTRQAMKRGILDPDEYEMELFNHADKRICPVCNALRGTRCPLPGGRYGGRSGPPFHPRCRDSENTVRRRDYAKGFGTRPYEVSADNITNMEVLRGVLDNFDKLSKKLPVNDLFGGFRSLDNPNVPGVVKHNAGEAFVTAWGQAFDKAGNRIRDASGELVNKIFVYLPPKNINENLFSEQLARMGIVHNGSMEGVVTHEFAHVLQLTAENKFGRNVPKSALEASIDAIRAAEITPKMIQKNVSMYANGFGAGDLKDSERFAELFTSIHAPLSDKVSKAFADKLLVYQKKTNEIFKEYGGVGDIV
jgi:hypothetical protein